MKPLRVAVLGAGGRGRRAYGGFALSHPHLLQYVAVAEPDDARRDLLADEHDIPAEYRFRTWQELVDARPPADAVFNCLQDALHIDSAVAVLEAGYHQLLEKPMATTPHDCVRIVRTAHRTGRTLAICHVLRYTPFFQAVKRVLGRSDLGEIVTVDHKEHVAFWHHAHSFTRGPWGVTAESSPMILAKSCHDLDILTYLIDRKPVRLSSFGGLKYFRPEHAPAGAPESCLDGCPAESTCPYSVRKTYLGGNRPDWIRNSSHLGVADTYEEKVAALRNSRLGRCVFKAGNDVVDHQTVMIEFEDDLVCNFMMHSFSMENTRTMRYGCTLGELKGHLNKNEIRLGIYADGREEVISPGQVAGGHAGGDVLMMHQFIDAIVADDPARVLTNVDVSLDSHLLAFAAEESRLSGGQVIDMTEYRRRIESEVE